MTGAPRRDERGTITLWVLGLCIGLMFLGGLSLDLWRAVGDRRQLSAMADTAATAAASGVDEAALRAGILRLDPERARAIALGTLHADPHGAALDAIDVEIAGNLVTVTLRIASAFSLLGIFMGGRGFDVEVHASARPDERS